METPYTPTQALAIALFNSENKGTLNDCILAATCVEPYLRQMGWAVVYTGETSPLVDS